MEHCEKCQEAAPLTIARYRGYFAGDAHLCDDCLDDTCRYCVECGDWVEKAEFAGSICNECAVEIARKELVTA